LGGRIYFYSDFSTIGATAPIEKNDVTLFSIGCRSYLVLYCNVYRKSKVKQAERDVVFARLEVRAATRADASQELSCSQLSADTVAANSEASLAISRSQSEGADLMAAGREEAYHGFSRSQSADVLAAGGEASLGAFPALGAGAVRELFEKVEGVMAALTNASNNAGDVRLDQVPEEVSHRLFLQREQMIIVRELCLTFF